MSNLAFIDFETRSPADVTVCGAFAYSHHPSTEALVLTWAFDDDDVMVWSPYWCWPESSQASIGNQLLLEKLHAHVTAGGYVVAWNMNFDRHIWNDVMVPKYGWPRLAIEQTLCAQALAEANNLPGKLDKACAALQLPRKDTAGGKLIAELSHGTRADWNPENHAKLGRFRAYGAHDTEVMRNVWQACRPLALSEWAEYHASEVINDRGVAVDVEFAAAATRYAQAETYDINAQLYALTGDPKVTLTNHLAKAKWLHTALACAPELQQMVARPSRLNGNGEEVERHSADRNTRETITAALANPDFASLFEYVQLNRITDFLDLIDAGNSAAVRKFAAIVEHAFEGRVHGSYSFSGAGQTGRYSSRGVQMHNMIRAALDKADRNRAIDAIEDIIDGAGAASLAEVYELPVTRLLARLIRPTFVASEGKTLVWGDWDQIEARVLPWLAKSPGGEKKLDLFRTGADIYRHAAAPIFEVKLDAVTDAQRTIGKVVELALGFGGGAGAFASMGRNYGVVLPATVVTDLIARWRAMNLWARHFWDALWDAAMAAYRNPGVWYHAGRMAYLFHPDLLRGTLIALLPDGRWLLYPQLIHELYVNDKGERRWRTTFMKGFGGGAARVDLWYGVLAENATQATAAAFLRAALVEMQDCVVLHTHDELVTEVDVREEARARSRLDAAMRRDYKWADGLPLSVTIDSGPFYTK